MLEKKSFCIPNPCAKHPIAILRLVLLNIPFQNQIDAVFESLSMANKFGEFMEEAFSKIGLFGRVHKSDVLCLNWFASWYTIFTNKVTPVDVLL